MSSLHTIFFFFFFFNDTATTEIYTLSLHDALPISFSCGPCSCPQSLCCWAAGTGGLHPSSAIWRDRKSTRLNSSHSQISYAVFCLKKKKKGAINAHTVEQNDHLPMPALIVDVQLA